VAAGSGKLPDGPAVPSAAPSSSPWVVVGLGNPGPAYAGTRHNLGFVVVDRLADSVGARFKGAGGRIGNRAEIAETRLAGERAVLTKPRSYMNESGGPVASVAAFFRAPPNRLVVVHDELDLDFGRIKIKLGGGDAGHNGLRSLRRSLGTGDFVRVRCGIGRPPGRTNAADWVLRDFSPLQRKEIPALVDLAAEAVEIVVVEGVEAAQRRFHPDPG
jgi:PTH1 family peptidyl-tRNA hydrolase